MAHRQAVKSLLVAVALLAVLLSSAACFAQQPSQSASAAPLKQFLQQYIAGIDPAFANDKTARFSTAAARLDAANPDKQDFLVYLTGREWCGTGGCLLLVLEPDGAGYKIIGRTSLVRLPIRILPTLTNGYHDLGVWVQGGGFRPAYEAALPFNGKAYAGNPTIPPAHLNAKVTGDVLIQAAATSEALF